MARYREQRRKAQIAKRTLAKAALHRSKTERKTVRREKESARVNTLCDLLLTLAIIGVSVGLFLAIK